MPKRTPENLSDLATIFKALGHPARLWIVHSLARGEMCVCDFVTGLKGDFSSVSQHLSVLKKIGVVKAERRGKHVFYTLIYKSIPWLIECMEVRGRSDRLTTEEWSKLARKHRKAFIKHLMDLDLSDPPKRVKRKSP